MDLLDKNDAWSTTFKIEQTNINITARHTDFVDFHSHPKVSLHSLRFSCVRSYLSWIILLGYCYRERQNGIIFSVVHKKFPFTPTKENKRNFQYEIKRNYSHSSSYIVCRSSTSSFAYGRRTNILHYVATLSDTSEWNQWR